MKKKKQPVWTVDDLCYALENAAEFLEDEEWPEPADKAAQEAANREGACRIRKMSHRLNITQNAGRTCDAPKETP